MSVETSNKQTYRYARLIVVMGTTGCGKSTIAERLSEHLNAAYLEGDNFHESVIVIANGMPFVSRG